ncbi:M48 family metallopeptidase [Tautonia plasticadhaerens]|uniref:Peptidase family M48 n=1 Tax=Tautonia plasticadhaerens TaxID=2527974 RepID=A0A518GVG9_9BACT|nr:M48 family metallopeptidase [Tautonia plasticadhaerens]QDV32584.1 Peptidase family M48 [Tautonia plasticadhaerens]
MKILVRSVALVCLGGAAILVRIEGDRHRHRYASPRALAGREARLVAATGTETDRGPEVAEAGPVGSTPGVGGVPSGPIRPDQPVAGTEAPGRSSAVPGRDSPSHGPVALPGVPAPGPPGASVRGPSGLAVETRADDAAPIVPEGAIPLPFEPRNAGEVAVVNPPGDRPEFSSINPATLMSDGERDALGRAVHALVLESLLVFRGGPLQDRVERLAAPLVTSTERNGPGIRIFLVESDGVFAFAHVGGYLYVSRGVFALAASDSELQFVVGHELGHLELGHCLGAVDRSKDGPGPAGRAFSGLVDAGSVAEEREADRWAYDALLGLGRSRRECLGFLMRLEGYARSRGIGLDPGDPEANGSPGPRAFEEAYCPAPGVSDRVRSLLHRPSG